MHAASRVQHRYTPRLLACLAAAVLSSSCLLRFRLASRVSDEIIRSACAAGTARTDAAPAPHHIGPGHRILVKCASGVLRAVALVVARGFGSQYVAVFIGRGDRI